MGGIGGGVSEELDELDEFDDDDDRDCEELDDDEEDELWSEGGPPSFSLFGRLSDLLLCLSLCVFLLSSTTWP